MVLIPGNVLLDQKNEKCANRQIQPDVHMCMICIFKQYQNLYTVKHENECKPANTISILYLLF